MAKKLETTLPLYCVYSPQVRATLDQLGGHQPQQQLTMAPQMASMPAMGGMQRQQSGGHVMMNPQMTPPGMQPAMMTPMGMQQQQQPMGMQQMGMQQQQMGMQQQQMGMPGQMGMQQQQMGMPGQQMGMPAGQQHSMAMQRSMSQPQPQQQQQAGMGMGMGAHVPQRSPSLGAPAGFGAPPNPAFNPNAAPSAPFATQSFAASAPPNNNNNDTSNSNTNNNNNNSNNNNDTSNDSLPGFKSSFASF
jgi:hypothetical protein